MITIKEIQTSSGENRVVRARKARPDDELAYQLEFKPNQSSLNAKKNISCKVVLEPQNGSSMISYTFQLERGLYDVYVTKVIGRDNNSVQLDEVTEKYPKPVMVGNPYTVGIIVEASECYGERGALIKIKTKDDELRLGNDVLSYTIDSLETENIFYHIPFNQSNRITFFVKGISVHEIKFHMDNPSFQLKLDIRE